MKKELAANHPNIKLVDVVYGNDDDQTSFDKTAALLQKHPNLKGIISPTTVGIAAAARYLSTSNAKGKVALTGLGTPNQMRKYVKDGTVKEFALWNPEDLGYLAAYAAERPGRRRHQRRGGRHVQGRQARQVHRRRRRHRPAGRPVQVQQVQHRPVQLLSRRVRRSTRGGGPAPRTGPPPRHRPRQEVESMERVCFQLQVQPGPARGVPRPPRARCGRTCSQALAATGWHNYSLFLREDGLLIGYFETADLAGGPGRHGRHRGQRPVAGRDGRVLRRPRADARPDDRLPALAEIFHLEDQLAADCGATRGEDRR